MPILRLARSLAAASLALAVLFVGVAPGPAAALEPPRPLPDYRPAFVTETDVRPWTDCLWASGAMLLDKWTNGDVRVGHRQLRRLSGDRGGSSLQDLQVAFRRLGFGFPLGRGGEGTLTWGQLLTRLGKGAGAVVLGDDSDLPRWYGRWDYAFWKKSGKKDNHAVYVERYEARNGRVWLMDPLARGDWQGEWISVSALQQFAWFSGGHVTAVATPTAKAAPFKGVRASSAHLSLSGDALTAAWNLRTPRRWRYPGADLHVAFTPAVDPVAAAIRTAQLAPQPSTAKAPARPVVTFSSDRTLRLTTPLPGKPGVYVASTSLRERRFGRTVLRSEPVAVFVPGARRATLGLTISESVLDAGGDVVLNLNVTNGGELTWADPSANAADGPARTPRSTRVTATWVRLDGGADGSVEETTSRVTVSAPSRSSDAAVTAGAGAARGDASGRPVPLKVVLARVPLAPGRMSRIRETLTVPRQTGHWALVVDVVDDVDGPFSSLGSAPAVALFQVVAP